MSGLSSTLRATAKAERLEALRQLLRRPLILAERDQALFATIARHRGWLTRWFEENAGWALVVEAAAGLARLHKVPYRIDSTRPAALNGKPPFDRRRYTLLCLTLASLEESSAQTTLARLAEAVEAMSHDEPSIPPFDPDALAERRAFVDVLRWLVDVGALGLRDGDADRYANTREADALYDINDRVLTHLVAAPIPPSLADDLDGLLRETYPDGEEGDQLRARHRSMRALMDDPVVYFEDLEPEERRWIDANWAKIRRRLGDDLGLTLERRLEGIAVIDPEAQVGDELFPHGGSTVKHAALLLAEQLTTLARGQPEVVIGQEKLLELTTALMDDYGARCRWAKEYRLTPGGASHLADEAIRLLERFSLVTCVGEGWRARPAIARFAPAPPESLTPTLFQQERSR
jgi:uncharacterized protein (TIGR02678 family)